MPGAPKPPIFTRAEWGATPPRNSHTTTLAGHIGIHHTATVEDFAASTREECAARVRAIQTYHIDTRGWSDIGYAYVVCEHGHILQAREDDDDTTDLQGAHYGFNKGSAGISALGAVVDNIYGYREVSATACPGDNLFARRDALRTAVSDQVLRQLY